MPFLSNNMRKIIYCLYLFSIMAVSAVFVVNRPGSITVKAIIIATEALVMSFSCFLFKRFKKSASVILIAVFGIAYLVVMPMMQIPDDTGHYLRSYEISQGRFVTEREEGLGVSYLPGNLYPEEVVPRVVGDENHVRYKDFKGISYTLDKDTPVRYVNSTQAMYSPVNYLPQAIGCFIADIFTDNTLIIYYSARILNFIVCLLLLAISIKIVPSGKRLFLVVAGMPMFLQQMTSLSTDSVTNSVVILLVSLVMNICRKEGKCSKGECAALIALDFTLALCKMVYLPICFLVLLIPNKKLPGHKKAIICSGSVALNLSWLFYSLGYLTEFRAGVDSKAQLMFVLTNIPAYVGIFFRTVFIKAIDWAGTMVGAKLGTLSIMTNLILISAYIIMLGLEILFRTEEEKTILSRGQKVLLCILFFGIWALTLSCLYLQWTPVGNEVIEGFQGRYLIPLIPILGFGLKLLDASKIGITSDQVMKYEVPMIVGTNVCAIAAIMYYYMY